MKKPLYIIDINNRTDLQIITYDTEEGKEAHKILNTPPKYKKLSLFIKTENGDITEAYGFEGIIPYLSKQLITLKAKPK